MLGGQATPDGTAAYARDHATAPGHMRVRAGLTLASIGMGTYLGSTDPAARSAYRESAKVCLAGGINVLDTAANYRDQASERDLGQALKQFVDKGGDRSGIVVATKAGFLHGDCDAPEEAETWFASEYVDAGILQPRDVTSGHSLAPAYVRHEVGRSRRNLGLECLDVVFLHNVEHPLEWGVAEPEFLGRVEDAFHALEEACDQGHIARYGIATWDGLRVGPDRKGHLSLVKLVHHAGQARMRAGGRAGQHHFRALELPVNAWMTEAAMVPTQPFRFGAQTALECARDLDTVVFASASMLQQRRRVPAEFMAALGEPDPALAALQFTRSVPGVTTALAGLGREAHARAAVGLAQRLAPQTGAAKTLMGTGSIHG